MGVCMDSGWRRRDAASKSSTQISLAKVWIQSLPCMGHVGGLLQLWGDLMGDCGEEEATEGAATPVVCPRAVPAGH